MSVRKTLLNLNGKRVVKRITGVYTTSTIDDFRKLLEDTIIENEALFAESNLSIKDFKDEGDKFTFGAHFWMKPKLKAETFGTLYFRSKDYYFVPEGTDDRMFGDLKGIKFSDDFRKFEKDIQVYPSKGLVNQGTVATMSFELAPL
ncbi:hypothetical protein GD1_202 [Paraglaciecola Antarctic GD virus 1]|nr:hypothetical protein GD1_202 [Paraglaciecola Antarctic GD virus 1]